MQRREPPARLVRALLGAALAILAACGGGPAPEDAVPQAPPPPPDLTGAVVMLLPVQLPTPEGLDAEIARELAQRVPRTEWIGRDELQAVIDRTRPWRLRLDALPPGIGAFGKERYVTDPLHGHLRRLGALVDATVALLPYAATEVTDSAGTTVQISAALLDIAVGRVLWMGTVRGEPAPAGAPGAAAGAAEALARSLIP